jgi:hypothetical protein
MAAGLGKSYTWVADICTERDSSRYATHEDIWSSNCWTPHPHKMSDLYRTFPSLWKRSKVTPLLLFGRRWLHWRAPVLPPLGSSMPSSPLVLSSLGKTCVAWRHHRISSTKVYGLGSQWRHLPWQWCWLGGGQVWRAGGGRRSGQRQHRLTSLI